MARSTSAICSKEKSFNDCCFLKLNGCCNFLAVIFFVCIVDRNGSVFFTVDEGHVYFGSEDPVPFAETSGFNKTFISCQWNHVTVVWRRDGVYNIYLNGINLKGGNANVVFPHHEE